MNVNITQNGQTAPLWFGHVDFGQCAYCDKPATHYRTAPFSAQQKTGEPVCNDHGRVRTANHMAKVIRL